MNAHAQQAASSDRQSRSLKIEATGDYFYRKVRPMIRLSGQWLERAGFKPAHRVEVHFEQHGTLTLRFLAQAIDAETSQNSKSRTETGQTICFQS
jgi:hypothetical protein